MLLIITLIILESTIRNIENSMEYLQTDVSALTAKIRDSLLTHGSSSSDVFSNFFLFFMTQTFQDKNFAVTKMVYNTIKQTMIRKIALSRATKIVNFVGDTQTNL